jgi:DNA-binding PadR family transcriptional regulator
MHELRGFQRDLLFVVGGLEEPNGQELLEEMEASSSEDVQPGRLYKNLNGLVEQGLLEKDREDGRTNLYDLTDEGRRKLEDRHEWERNHLEPGPD